MLEAQTAGAPERRAGRHERREEWRAGWHERREERRTGTTTGTGDNYRQGTGQKQALTGSAKYQRHLIARPQRTFHEGRNADHPLP